MTDTKSPASVLRRLVIEPDPRTFAVCRVRSFRNVNPEAPGTFLASTGSELSLVCPEEAVPPESEKVEPGWRMFRVAGTLDFALVGILAAISSVLSEHRISLFAVSTFDTDYVLVKADCYGRALEALRANGARIRP